MAKNVRLHSKKGQARDLAQQKAPATAPTKKSPPPRTANLREEAELNRQRMERLEMVIATAGASAACNRSARGNYLPPMERNSARRSPQPERRPHHRQQLERRESAALLVQVSILFVVIAAVIGWLNQRFHFLG